MRKPFCLWWNKVSSSVIKNLIGWIVSFLKPSTFNLETSGTIFLEDIQVKNEKKCWRKKTIALLINFWNFCCAHIEKIDSLKLLFVCRLFGIKIFLVMKVSNDYVRIWVSTSAILSIFLKIRIATVWKVLTDVKTIEIVWRALKSNSYQGKIIAFLYKTWSYQYNS